MQAKLLYCVLIVISLVQNAIIVMVTIIISDNLLIEFTPFSTISEYILREVAEKWLTIVRLYTIGTVVINRLIMSLDGIAIKWQAMIRVSM